MPVPVSQGRVKKFTTDGPIPPPHSRRGVVPQVDPTKKLVAAPGQLLDRPGAIRSSTRRGRGVPCGRHPPYRLRRPVPLSLLSPLPQTATLGRETATPPIRAFPQLPGRLDIICSPPQRGREAIRRSIAHHIACGGHPAYPHCRQQRRPAGGWRRPYPHISPTAGPTRCHLLSPTARQRVYTPRYRPPYRLLRSASLSPLPPTAMPGWGMATPPIRAFPQRRPARSTPYKPKGSVLPRFIGPGGRARRAKKCIGLRVGGAKRVAASKGRIAAEKEAGPIPLAVVLQGAMAVAIGKKGGRCRDLSPPPRRPVQNSLPFPAPLPNRRGRHPTPSRLPMPPPLSWVAGPSTPHRRSAPSPTPSPVRPRQTPLPPMERPILPRGPAARNRNRGQTRQGQNFPPPGQGKFCLPR